MVGATKLVNKYLYGECPRRRNEITFISPKTIGAKKVYDL